MDRRLFLRNIGIIAAGLVAVDQLELLDKLTKGRSMLGWTGASENLVHYDEMYALVEGEWTMTTFLKNVVAPISKANYERVFRTFMQDGPLLRYEPFVPGVLPVVKEGEPFRLIDVAR